MAATAPAAVPFERSWISQPSQGSYNPPFPSSAYEVNFKNILDTIFLRHISVDYIENWRWHEGRTWLSDTWTVVLVCLVYVAIVHGLHFIIRRTKPFDLNWFVIIHNALLSISSGVLFIALFSELWRLSSAHGLWTVFCDADNSRQVQFNYGRIYFIYYINYLFKYWELLDTFLLALRGKPTPFLHVYHHAATLYLCWSQLGAESCVQWVVIVINLFVHIIMYAYYTLHALKIDVWWKKIVTQIQIIQFIIALSACWLGFSARLLHDYGGLLWVDHCSGSYPGAIVGIAILSSYLLLFIQFFIDTYRAKKRAKAAKAALDKAANGNGHTQTNGQLNGNGHSNGHSKHD